MAKCANIGGGMPWWKVKKGDRNDPRVRRLRAVLRQPLADAYWLRLRDYCGDHQSDGRFVGADGVEIIERVACEWDGEDGTLVAAMIKAQLLVEAAGAYEVADWHTDQSAHVAKFERDAAKRKAPHATRDEPARVPQGSTEGPSPYLNTLVFASSDGSDVARARVAESVPAAAPGERRRFQLVGEESLPDAVQRVTGWAWTSGKDDAAARALFALATSEGRRDAASPTAEIIRRLENGYRAEFKRKVCSLSELARPEKWRACDTPEDGRKGDAQQPPPPSAPQRQTSSKACAGCGQDGDGAAIGDEDGGVWLGYGCGCLPDWQAERRPYAEAAAWAKARRTKP